MCIEQLILLAPGSENVFSRKNQPLVIKLRVTGDNDGRTFKSASLLH